MQMIEVIFKSILISVIVYLCIALILIVVDGKDRASNIKTNKILFRGLKKDYSNIPGISKYIARDNSELAYRYYNSNSDKILILLHGSGWHSKYFYTLANEISSNNYASVYTPDLRGHGINPRNRGDIKYINQYEDDLHDFILFIKEKHPGSKIILGGHSSGGGLAIRYGGSKYGEDIDSFLLLSPYLKYNALTMKKNSGGWTSLHLPRIIGLSMLNNIGIRFLNFLDIIDFNMPENYRDGTETLTYSYRLNTGYAPRNYKEDLKKTTQDLYLLAGSNDESFIAEMFYPVISEYKPDVELTIIEDVTHMGIVFDKRSIENIKKWLRKM